ncbi:hypothetical protein Sjap_010649 [Stephania japonica]|uniref:CASP-like protein n=1 Tax=Stephania japonica TaxID=461633 RepID=A0AAP0P3W2_9MAGN
MEFLSLKGEVCLRSLCASFLVSAAFIVGLDSQTQHILGDFEKKATIKDLPTLRSFVIVVSCVAGYQIIQLILCLVRVRSEKNPRGFNKVMAWTTCLMDQILHYLTFGTTLAAAQLALLSLTGAEDFEWLKLHHMYTRFRVQMGCGICFGALGGFVMLVMAPISAFHLFRFYSWTHFLALKPKPSHCPSNCQEC